MSTSSFHHFVLVFRGRDPFFCVFRPAKRFSLTGFEHLLLNNSSFRHPPELTNEAMSCHAHGETHLRLPTIHTISVHGLAKVGVMLVERERYSTGRQCNVKKTS